MTGAIRLRLHEDPQEGDDRRVLYLLESTPQNAVVYVEMGARTWLTTDAVQILHRHAQRLRIMIIADSPWVVEKFVNQVRRGSNESEVA